MISGVCNSRSNPKDLLTRKKAKWHRLFIIIINGTIFLYVNLMYREDHIRKRKTAEWLSRNYHYSIRIPHLLIFPAFFPRQSFPYHRNLTPMIGFMFTYMKPFAKIIGRFFPKEGWIHFSKPFIISFFKFCQRFCPYFLQNSMKIVKK